LSRTAKLYPRIFQRRVREHLGARGTFWWLASIAEAAFSERRARAAATAVVTAAGGDATGAEQAHAPAEEFARYVAFYKKDQGSGASD
jgi:hypothetical protein